MALGRVTRNTRNSGSYATIQTLKLGYAFIAISDDVRELVNGLRHIAYFLWIALL